MRNGAPDFTAITGMKEHYVKKIWLGDEAHMPSECAPNSAMGAFDETLFGPVV